MVIPACPQCAPDEKLQINDFGALEGEGCALNEAESTKVFVGPCS